jgi:GTPase SAR1 family protein
VVLTKIADEVLGFARGIYGAGANLLGESTIRLGVTGLAHSGKTTFITSLVANLLDRGRERRPHSCRVFATTTGRYCAAF